MSAEPRSIGIFGGTFDPVHNGHISIAQSFLESGYIDSLWVFLNPAPPHKTDGEFASYAARFKMLQAVFGPIGEAIVSDLESSLPKPCYTHQTLTYLKNTYPQHTFYLCIGKDSFLSFETWYKWERILEFCTLLVAERPKENGTVSKKLYSSAKFVDHQPVKVSSTEIRKKIKLGEPIDDLVPETVLSIIERDNLYKK